jgi:hypothetical protein
MLGGGRHTLAPASFYCLSSIAAQHKSRTKKARNMKHQRMETAMAVNVQGWVAFADGDRAKLSALIDWKLSEFKKVGWGGSKVSKWGGTASVDVPLSDNQVPVGCVSTVDGNISGVSFIIDNDLKNYPVDGVIPDEFVGEETVSGEVANPWFAGHLVHEDQRRLGLSRKQEQWVIAQAKKMADAGEWPYAQRRIWLFTEREPLAFLPEMYMGWGWKLHRTFKYDGLQRWVLFKDF